MNTAHLIRDVGGLALYTWGPRVLETLTRRQQVELSRRLGSLLCRISAEDRALLADELSRTLDPDALPDSPEALIEQAFQIRMFDQLETLTFPSLTPSTIDEVCVLEGREHLDAALEKGKGAILMIGHYGSNLMIMPALGHRGYRVNQLSASPTAWAGIRQDGRVNPIWQRVQESRAALVQSLPVSHIDVFGFLRPAYTCLARNEVLGLAFDGGGGSRWVPTTLGQRTAWVSTQPWQLARTTGATVLPTVVLRQPGQHLHRVVIQAPLAVPQTSDKADDLAQAAQAYGKWFTRWLRKRPSHYLFYQLLRRRVRDTDERAFFEDYPQEDDAAAHLR